MDSAGLETIGACLGITSTARLLAHARFLPTVGRY
jgi:hypothetical protein